HGARYMVDPLPNCSYANACARLLKEARAPLRCLVPQLPSRKVEIAGGASRRSTERGHLCPAVFNTLRQEPLLRSPGLGRISETQRAEKLEAHLGVGVVRHLRELLDQVGMAHQLGLRQANGILPHPCLRVIERLPEQVLIQLSQALQRP